MHGGADRANLFARSVLALLAGNGLKIRRRIVKRRDFDCFVLDVVGLGRQTGFKITVDANPIHFAPAHHLIFANDGNVVLRLARHDASAAAVALGQINGHRPLVVLVVAELLKILVERQTIDRRFVFFVRKIRIFLVFLERSRTDDFAAFHVVMILRASDRILVVGDSKLAAGRSPQSVRRTHRVSVEPFVRTSFAGLHASVAERENHDVVRLPGNDPRRSSDFASGEFDVYNRGAHLPVFAASGCDGAANIEAFRRRRAHQRSVVPGRFGRGLGEFLQPTIICKAPVVDCRIGPEDKFQFARLWRRRWRHTRRAELRGNGNWSKRRARDQAIVQRLAPILFSVAATQNRLHLFANGVFLIAVVP